MGAGLWGRDLWGGETGRRMAGIVIPAHAGIQERLQ
jgi:hypothetical protein